MRRILTVFIASPSDLADERKKTFEVVAEINEVVKNFDWSIDLLGWEDTLPGYGRPQALINRDVERCDLFIGMLWRRWGTAPTPDSRFSSGFEEEFSIAMERRGRTPSPEIWMFFKTVESAQVADAGAQLQVFTTDSPPKVRDGCDADAGGMYKQESMADQDGGQAPFKSRVLEGVGVSCALAPTTPTARKPPNSHQNPPTKLAVLSST